MKTEEPNVFFEKMQKMDDEQLLNILEHKNDYQPLALVAAIKEIGLRKLLPENELQKLLILNENVWHYEQNGRRIGPSTTIQIEGLIKDGTISYTTLVWQKGFENWKLISETELNEYLKVDVPPPLMGEKVDNSFIWVLAFAPIIGSIIESLFFSGISYGGSLFFWVVLNSGLAIIDDMKLKNAGHKTNNLVWAIFLVPVYLWRRANLTKQSKSYFWVWIISLVISMLIESAFQ